jgi:hypothetical protein
MGARPVSTEGASRKKNTLETLIDKASNEIDNLSGKIDTLTKELQAAEDQLDLLEHEKAIKNTLNRRYLEARKKATEDFKALSEHMTKISTDLINRPITLLDYSMPIDIDVNLSNHSYSVDATLSPGMKIGTKQFEAFLSNGTVPWPDVNAIELLTGVLSGGKATKESGYASFRSNSYKKHQKHDNAVYIASERFVEFVGPETLSKLPSAIADGGKSLALEALDILDNQYNNILSFLEGLGYDDPTVVAAESLNMMIGGKAKLPSGFSLHQEDVEFTYSCEGVVFEIPATVIEKLGGSFKAKGPMHHTGFALVVPRLPGVQDPQATLASRIKQGGSRSPKSFLKIIGKRVPESFQPLISLIEAVQTDEGELKLRICNHLIQKLDLESITGEKEIVATFESYRRAVRNASDRLDAEKEKLDYKKMLESSGIVDLRTTSLGNLPKLEKPLGGFAIGTGRERVRVEQFEFDTVALAVRLKARLQHRIEVGSLKEAYAAVGDYLRKKQFEVGVEMPDLIREEKMQRAFKSLQKEIASKEKVIEEAGKELTVIVERIAKIGEEIKTITDIRDGMIKQINRLEKQLNDMRKHFEGLLTARSAMRSVKHIQKQAGKLFEDVQKGVIRW